MDQLLASLQGRYAVDPDTCRQETEAFISEALKSGMLQEQAPA